MRKATLKRHRSLSQRRIALTATALLLAVGPALYVTIATHFLRGTRASRSRPADIPGLACVGWKQTRSCSPYGVRDYGGDKDCSAEVSQASGYCECESNLTINRMHCSKFRPFTCHQACSSASGSLQALERLPGDVTCEPSGLGSDMLTAATWARKHGGQAAGVGAVAGSDQAVQPGEVADRVWHDIAAARAAAVTAPVQLPETRTVDRDWVRDGVHIPRDDIEMATAQWVAFLEGAPGYPGATFRGRGIVILAGGLTYMVPAWVNVHMLRRTGCALPVEVFFAAHEFPTPQLEAALVGLGVTCRRLPGSAVRADPTHGKGGQELSGFTMKIAALLLSRFEEVVFLDSDNVALADPVGLLESAEYRATGALLWPDYWQSSAAPDLAAILGGRDLSKGTFESGQMVLHKKRVWRGLLLVAYFNLEADFYYELFSNYMGKGDKESFAHAFWALQLPFGVVRHRVGSVGEVRQHCQPSGPCRERFLGNTMAQFSPDGRLMFLHTNLSPKWNLAIPGNFSHYRRRWKTVMPGNSDFVEAFGDLERDVYDILVDLRCHTFLPEYVQALAVGSRQSEERLQLGLAGFHPVNPGIDFAEVYRWGLAGPFLAFAQVSFTDGLWHFANTTVKSRLGYLRRLFDWLVGRLLGRETYFVLA